MNLGADLGWMVDHLDELAYRTFQHLLLTAIGVGVGFLISFVLAVVASVAASLYPISFCRVLYTIPASRSSLPSYRSRDQPSRSEVPLVI